MGGPLWIRERDGEREFRTLSRNSADPRRKTNQQRVKTLDGRGGRSQRIVADDGEQVAQGEKQKQIKQCVEFLFANYAELGFEGAQD